MSEFGKELIDSANEALAIAEGRPEPARVIAPETVRKLTDKLHRQVAKREPLTTLRQIELC